MTQEELIEIPVSEYELLTHLIITNMQAKLTKSKEFTEEYCCSIVRVGALVPVENSDNLMKTTINGESIVVNKADVKEGDVMLYISNECKISGWFLGANNLYRHHTLNANAAVVEEKIKADPAFLKTEEAKAMVGYFEDNGRVRMIKLRGCPSFGVLFKPESLERAVPPIAGCIDFEAAVGTDFDCIECDNAITWGGDKVLHFVRAYVPKRTQSRQPGQKGVSRWDIFDRMVPGQFKLHYDTALLKKHLMDFSKETEVTVTVKMHGTSFICGNVLVNTPLRFFRFRRLLNKMLRLGIREFKQEYGMVVSSRKVIRNEWANCKHPEGYYGVDIWTEYGKIIYPYIPQGYTIYGEICGYLSGETRMIQNGYDYGCKVGENFLMPYRVTKQEDGRMVDLCVEDVGHLTSQIIIQMQAAGDVNADRLLDIRKVSVFAGNVAGLVGHDGDISDFPEKLAEQGKIENDEPLCKNKVPREGVVVRINGDEIPEAFKLKSVRFLEREKTAIDKGEVDIEMQANNEEEI